MNKLTVGEAIDQGIKVIHCDPWNKYAHMILPEKLPDGTHGPWAHLIDPCSNLALGDPADKKLSIILVRGITPFVDSDPMAAVCKPWVEPADYRVRFGNPIP